MCIRDRFDLAEARAVAAWHQRAGGVGEGDFFFQRLEAGLPQQDRHRATRRAFDQRLGLDAALQHRHLRGVDVQRAGGEVVDVGTTEADHVGDQQVPVSYTHLDVYKRQ